MKLSPQFPAVAGMVLFCMVLPACTGAPPPSPIAEAPAAVDAPAGWADLLGPTSAPENWQVEPCQNPVLLCVTANGKILGTVERFSSPLSEVSWPGAMPTTPVAQRQFLEI